MSAWRSTPCSRTCGGGHLTMVRSVVQQPTEVDGVQGKACLAKTQTSSCNNVECPTFRYEYSAWSKCTRPCGAGTMSRIAQCRSSTGESVHSSNCAGNPVLEQDCNTQQCGNFYFTTTAWSACSQKCTGSDGVVGKKTRAVACVEGLTGAPATDESKCTDTRPPAEAGCNKRQCVTYEWRVGAYQACSKTCGGGKQYRTVSCVASDGSVVTDAASSCGSSAPNAATDCNTQKCDWCAGQTCSGHGTCADSKCTCDTGYKGLTCDTEASCDGAKAVDGVCCVAPGVLDRTGACCQGALDSNSVCCPYGRTVDKCGVCGGTGVGFDVLGNCCSGSAPKLDEGGICCGSGVFDTCGVCDGDGSSCNVDAVVSPSTSSISRRRLASETDVAAFVADFTRSNVMKDDLAREAAQNVGVPQSAISCTLKAEGTTIQARLAFSQAAILANSQNAKPIDALEIAARLAGGSTSRRQLASGLITSDAVGPVEPKAVCGNGACEPGERCQDADCTGGCRSDCPYEKKTCPSPSWEGGGECSGNGRCIGSSGACECFTAQGYVGAACSECAGDYLFDEATKKCKLDVSVMPTPSPTPSPTPVPTPSPTPAPTPLIQAKKSDYDMMVRIRTGLGGFSHATFGESAQDAYITALAARLPGVEAREIALSSVENVERRRNLGSLLLGRRLSAAGITFEVEILAKTDAAAESAKSTAIAELTSAAFKAAVKAQLDAASVPYNTAAFASFSITASSSGRFVSLSAVPSASSAGIGAALGVPLGLLILYVLYDKKLRAPTPSNKVHIDDADNTVDVPKRANRVVPAAEPSEEPLREPQEREGKTELAALAPAQAAAAAAAAATAAAAAAAAPADPSVTKPVGGPIECWAEPATPARAPPPALMPTPDP
eukprot:g8177.t1